MKPLLFAAMGVALILGAVLILPALTGRKGNGPPASGSPSPSAIVSNPPLQSATPSQSVGDAGPPTPFASYQQYKVQANDSVSRIAGRFHLKMWELLLANPQIPASLAVRINTYLNIPQPGQLTQPPPSPTALPTASAAASVVAP